jgi:WD40 repeat protein
LVYYSVLSFINQENGHKEDILCLAKAETNFIASSGYDGEVIVWNMVSGHIFAKLISPKPLEHTEEFCNNYFLFLDI